MGGIDHPNSAIGYTSVPLGWRCPECGAVKAPWISSCSCSVAKRDETLRPPHWPIHPDVVPGITTVPNFPHVVFQGDPPVWFRGG